MASDQLLWVLVCFVYLVQKPRTRYSQDEHTNVIYSSSTPRTWHISKMCNRHRARTESSRVSRQETPAVTETSWQRSRADASPVGARQTGGLVRASASP